MVSLSESSEADAEEEEDPDENLDLWGVQEEVAVAKALLYCSGRLMEKRRGGGGGEEGGGWEDEHPAERNH